MNASSTNANTTTNTTTANTLPVTRRSSVRMRRNYPPPRAHTRNGPPQRSVRKQQYIRRTPRTKRRYRREITTQSSPMPIARSANVHKLVVQRD